MNELDNLNKKNGTNQLIVSSLLFFLIWLNIDNMYAIMPRGDLFAQGKWVVFIIGLSKVIDSVNSAYSPIVAFSSLYKWVPYTVAANSIFAVIINYFFIGLYGYIGGAISNIILMLLVNIFYVILIHKKIKTNPFEKNQLKIVFVFLIFLSIPFFGNWFSNPFVDGIVRSILFGTSYVWILVKLSVSKDFNDLILSKLPLLKKII
jgi:O-antigen/teichoic acid export membrane protein